MRQARPGFPSTFSLVALLGLGCAHPAETGSQSARPSTGAVGTSPLAPFDVNLPSPNSREQLAQALRQRGFLAPDAPEGTQLGASIRAFQRSEGIRETGWPDDETLRRLGIDPRTVDRSLDTREVNQQGATGISPSH
jgi:peptidoglycan hydrolase-like protein with peptidoglycan-binding domain